MSHTLTLAIESENMDEIEAVLRRSFGTNERCVTMLKSKSESTFVDDDETAFELKLASRKAISSLQISSSKLSSSQARRSSSCTPSGNFNWQRFYLKNGKDNALHYATRLGKTDIVQFLLNTGHFQVNETNNSEEADTPLTIACDLGWLDTAKLLIERGADVDYENKKNKTPLILATELIMPFDLLICKILIKRGAHVNRRTRNGNSVLLNATKYGNLELIGALVEGANADVNQAFIDGTTALMRACYYNYHNLAVSLLQSGADVEAKNTRNETALYIACFRGNLDIVQLLVENHEARVNISDLDGDTPLSVACYEDKNQVIRFLLQNDACRVNTRGIRGDTPLHIAVSNCSNDIVQMLIEKGADVDAVNNENETPLHIAARHSRIDTIQTLLRHAKRLDVVSKYKMTAYKNLVVSLQAEKIMMAVSLMKAGCDTSLSFNDQEQLAQDHGADELRHQSTSMIPSSEVSPFEHIMKFCDETCHQIARHLDPLNALIWESLKPAIQSGQPDLNRVLAATVNAIQLLIKSGYKPTQLDKDRYLESHFRSSFRSSNLGNRLEKLLGVKSNSPARLVDICRLEIRRRVHKPLSSSISQLEIPRHLQSFLYFD